MSLQSSTEENFLKTILKYGSIQSYLFIKEETNFFKDLDFFKRDFFVPRT